MPYLSTSIYVNVSFNLGHSQQSTIFTIKIMKLAYKLINSYEYTNDRKNF